MKIWKDSISIDNLNATNKGTIHESLGILFVKIGTNFIEATMPVNEKTKNPVGILHGGASVVLAESLGSVASLLVSGSQNKQCVGIEVSASHLRSIQKGSILGRATPIRLGKLIHVWEIQIFDAAQPKELPICQARLTVMVKDQKPSIPHSERII